MGDGEKREHKAKKPSVLEWATAAVGAVLVSFCVGVMIYRGMTNGDAPPKITVEVESVMPAGERYLVAFRVKNDGDSAVASLRVEGESIGADGSAEVSDAVIAHVPSHSRRSGGLFFASDPRQGQFRLRVKGYEKP